MAILTTGNTYSDGNQITSTNLNAIVNSATFDDPIDTASGLALTSDTPPKIAINTSLSNKTLTGGSLNNCPIGAATPNTGAFTTLTASDDVNFDSGTLFVDASADRVGIGTTSPSNTFHVKNTTSSGAYIHYDGQSNTEFGLRVESNASGGNFESDFATGGTALLDLYANSATVSGGDLLVARTQSATPVLLVKGNGNVGIGTTSPAVALDVVGAGTITAGLNVGIDNATAGSVNVFGGANSAAEGGEIKLYNHADADGSYDFWRLDSDTNGFFRIGRAGQTDLTIDHDGYVGIGTTNADKTLVVAGVGAEIVIDDTDATDTPRLRFRESGSTSGSISTDAGELIFDSGTTERMRIDSSGNVGINNNNPAYSLDVNSGATNQVALFESTDATAYIELADNTGSVQLATPSSGDFKMYTGGSGAGNLGTAAFSVKANGDVGIGDDTPSYKLDVNGTARVTGNATFDGTISQNISGTASYFPGYHKDTFGAQLEDAGANGSTLYLGRDNQWSLTLGTSVSTNTVHSGKVATFYDTDQNGGGSPVVGAQVGSISITTSATAFNTSSDYRLKENEVDITDGIDRLKQLKPYRFNFKKDADTVVDGFFAHEVSPVVPESISGEKDAVDEDGKPEYQGIDQSKLVPLLTAALQEAVAKIEALEARVQTLEG